MQSGGKTNKKRWEDDINHFLKLQETEKTKGNDLKKTTTHGSGQQKSKNGWTEMESDHVKKAIKQQL